MVAHDEVVAFGYHLRSPVLVALVLLGDERVVHRHIVDVHLAVDDADALVFLGDHPLDEGLVGIDRVIEHHDVSRLRFTDRREIRELVDDQTILIMQRRGHALAFDASHLEAERHDERRVDGRRRERLQPGDELVGETAGEGRRLRAGRAEVAGPRGQWFQRRERIAHQRARLVIGKRVGGGEGFGGRRRGPDRIQLRLLELQGRRLVRPRFWRRRRLKTIRVWWRVVWVARVVHSLKYSRRRLVWERLTGISVPLASFIRNR